MLRVGAGMMSADERSDAVTDGHGGEVSTAVDSEAIRARLVEALELDLVGPWAGHAYAEERLRGWERPSNWYLTGFLIPTGTPPELAGDQDEDDDLDVVPEHAGLEEESADERRAAKKSYFPSSMGLSFLVPAACSALDVVVGWGDYDRGEMADKDGKPLSVWQRDAREEPVRVRLGSGSREPCVLDVPSSGGLQLHVVDRAVDAREFANEIPPGTRSISVFLINRRAPDTDNPDRAYAFQASLRVRCEESFVPRPDPRGSRARDWDERVADVHYADAPEYAAGHGVSAEWSVVDGRCRELRTAWVPNAEVERTETSKIEGATLGMLELGALADGEAAAQALRPLVVHYRAWIAAQRGVLGRLGDSRRETVEGLLVLARAAADRIDQGIETLRADPSALDAFRVANRAVARALQRRSRDDAPAWRAFQLAFVLLNVSGIADPTDPSKHRDTVDLLFFPTGGGKTEAYLGLAAYTMVLRRLRNAGLQSAGVSVLMRYTLRLLTLDQLGRAAGLVCALELERSADPGRYGTWPFEIGLWVGKAATPNRMGHKGDKVSDTARIKVRDYKRDPHANPSPIPIETCPWCGTRFEPDSFDLQPDADRPRELRIVCVNFECDFSRERPLPILAVDEPIYRRLPAFLIATVDKFASLPWVGPSGALLGGAERHDKHGFYGNAEPGQGSRLPAPLPPPDLIIQDELHLISGPLGTMAGLYETVIEALIVREVDGKAIKPKIVASTATVRQAAEQIQAVFGRPQTMVFPPPGPDRRDSFFARVVPSDAQAAAEVGVERKAARLYLGVASQGRNPKVILRRVWLALMGAAERAYRDAGGHRNEKNPADPYMTVLGYFNSLRELGGCRRILEEEVQNTLKGYGNRRRAGEDRGLFQDRKRVSEVMELTSRVPTSGVSEAKQRLSCEFHEERRVDFAIATNMISVGLDIPRLGLMVVLGQPKTHAEYIQATSRVGRDDQRPGLVVTLLNMHKPRDRSHYERFRHYHETFYRAVEPASVTPFSARALDRGFAGALVALARHARRELTPAEAVGGIDDVRAGLESELRDTFLRRVAGQPRMDEQERAERALSVQQRVTDLLDSWARVVAESREVGARMQYQKYEVRGPRPLLREMLDTDKSEDHRKFRANRSLRDVEPEVNLFLRELNGAEAGDSA